MKIKWKSTKEKNKKMNKLKMQNKKIKINK